MSKRMTLTRGSVLVLAAWYGLLTGLIEGFGFLSFGKLGWLNWDMATVPVGREILWVAPLFDLMLFSMVGVLLAVAGERFPLLRNAEFAAGVFGFLATFDWLALSGRIRHLGVIMLAAGLTAVLIRWLRMHEVFAFGIVRKSLPALATISLLLLIGIRGGEWLEERRDLARLPAPQHGVPNILVVMIDTLRADHLRSYGYARNTSPNIDRVAQQGVLFSNAYATSSWTLPSHASLLTGRYPGEHGAVEHHLDDRLPTVGEVLQTHGYRTACISANLLYFTRHQGFGRGFIHFEDDLHSLANMAYHTLYGRKTDQFILLPAGQIDLPARKRAADVTDAALHWIFQDSQKPFFLFLNYFDTHTPYLPPQPYRRMFAKTPNPGGLLNPRFGAGHQYPQLTAEQLQSEVDAYDGAVAYVDAHVGRLLEELGRHDLLINTLVVVMSDHGESFGEHGLLHHRNALYREVLRIPLIFLWPGHVPAGTRIDRPVSNVAFAATLFDLLGMDKPESFRGPSLAWNWTSSTRESEGAPPLAELAKFSYEDPKHPCRYGAMKCLISGHWHYIEHEKFGPELYDLEADPQELHNLVHSSETEPIAEDLRKRLEFLLSGMHTAR